MPVSKAKDIRQIHRNVVDEILSQHKPDNHIDSAWVQWFIWLAVSLMMIVGVVMMMGMQANAGQIFGRPSALGFMVIALVGAGLAAWEAIGSSIPSRTTSRTYKVCSGVCLGLLILMPFLFFYPWGESFDFIGSFKGGIDCVLHVSMLGVVPWMVLGWMLSRNASFHPGWTGAWSGTSSFLIGTLAVQLHCPIWDARHIFVAHLLPVALCVFITTFAGAYWFSRWAK